MVGEEYVGDCLEGCWFNRFVWRDDSPSRETVQRMVVYECVYDDFYIFRALKESESCICPGLGVKFVKFCIL